MNAPAGGASAKSLTKSYWLNIFIICNQFHRLLSLLLLHEHRAMRSIFSHENISNMWDALAPPSTWSHASGMQGGAIKLTWLLILLSLDVRFVWAYCATPNCFSPFLEYFLFIQTMENAHIDERATDAHGMWLENYLKALRLHLSALAIDNDIEKAESHHKSMFAEIAKVGTALTWQLYWFRWRSHQFIVSRVGGDDGWERDSTSYYFLKCFHSNRQSKSDFLQNKIAWSYWKFAEFLFLSRRRRRSDVWRTRMSKAISDS